MLPLQSTFPRNVPMSVCVYLDNHRYRDSPTIIDWVPGIKFPEMELWMC